MKAEHRKELQTNALADRIYKFFTNLKAGPKTTSITLWVVILAAVALGVGGWFWYKSVRTARSAQWVKLDSANKIDDLEQIIKEAPNTLPGRIARFEEARYYLAQGQRKLYSSTDRGKALEDLKKAQDRYDKLILESADTPSLLQEALMGAGVTRAARGEQDEAQKYFDRLAKEFPKQFLGKAAKKDADSVADRKEFQQELDKSSILP